MIYLYKITNRKTHEYYIGISPRPFKRWGEHAKADSNVGNALRLKDLKDFTWEIIDGYTERADAEKAEKNWIEGKFPALLNRAHNSPQVETNAVMLADNEHFKIVGEVGDVFVFCLKPTNENMDIKKPSINRNELPQLAPLSWWRKFLGIRAGARITDTHLLEIQDAVTQIVRKKTTSDGDNNSPLVLREAKITNDNYAIFARLLSSTVQASNGERYTIAEFMMYGYFDDDKKFVDKFADDIGEHRERRLYFRKAARRYGFVMRSPDIIWIAHNHSSLNELLNKSKYKNVDVSSYLQSLKGVKIPYTPSGATGKFRVGGRVCRAFEVPRDVFEAAGFTAPKKENVKD